MSPKAASVTELVLETASSAELDAVLRLLSENNLPTADLQSHIDTFTLARAGGTVVGTAGIEIYGELALLRSLCVAEPHRSKGIGVVLVATVASRAAAQGVRELYLLTTSAASYFADLGFLPLARDQAPLDIRDTVQFRTLCPSSAICMRKPIAQSIE